MIQELSILIPVYNDDATMLVKSLSKQAQAISGLCYEIVVFDVMGPEQLTMPLDDKHQIDIIE